MYRDLLEDAKKDQVQVIAVSTIIKNREQILLIEKGHQEEKDGHYEIPSAILKPGETFQQAIQRAVIEETNLSISNFLGFVGHFDFISSANIKHRQFAFAIEVEEPQSIQLKKHIAYAWLTPQEVVGYPISDELRSLIDQYARINFFPQGKL